MKIKHPFVLLAPLVFLVLSACDLAESMTVTIEFVIPCPLPPPVITDSIQLIDWYNGLCSFWVFRNDSLILVKPGAV